MIVKRTVETGALSLNAAAEAIAEAFKDKDYANKKLLCIIPDNTRSGPIGDVFKLLFPHLKGAAKLDCLVALGTHRTLSEAEILWRLCISEEERKGEYAGLGLFNHEWEKEESFASLGKIGAGEIKELSGGLLEETIEVRVNKLLLEYDELVILGPVFPHEVVGFSGGHKYIFPGVAGREIIDAFHWLGALVGLPAIIGEIDTPTRAVVEKAASLLAVSRTLVATVSRGEEFKGVLIGDPVEAWHKAARLSAQVNIERVDKPYHTVLGLAPEMYDDLWTAGKAAYKLGQVVADGGELIIYAPHVKEFSLSHGEAMERIGYYVRDYFTAQADKFEGESRCAMAHSTHVRGGGSFQNGVEKPRIEVVLATAIPRSKCEQMSLGYMDPAEIDISSYKGREAEGILFVDHAGEILHRLRPLERVPTHRCVSPSPAIVVT